MLARILARGITLLRTTLLFWGILPLLSGALLAACSSRRLAIEYDYDGDASFESLKTWSWLARDKSGTGSDNVDKILHEALTTLLERQGYRHVDSGGDFRVGYILETRRKVKTRYVNNYHDYDTEAAYFFNRVGGVEEQVIDYREGTLILDIAAADGKQPIWRGWASGAIGERMTESRIRAELTEACRQVLEKFPPPATRKKRS